MLLFAEAAIGVPYGLLLLGLASLTGLWSVAALLTRRLHDMNLSAAHAMFVYGLNLFALGFAIYNPSIGVALTVFMLGASIWFLLTPGSASRTESATVGPVDVTSPDGSSRRSRHPTRPAPAAGRAV